MTARGAHVGELPKPTTRRGLKTRTDIVVGARTVFEEHGFLNARIQDMAIAADVAIGTFYTYFRSKEDVFAAVVDELGIQFVPEVRHEVPDTSELSDEAKAVARIRAGNIGFLRAYRANKAMIAAIEEAATAHDRGRAIRRRLRNKSVDRLERSIRRLQQQGLTDASLDAHCAAAALASMASNLAYASIVLGEPFADDVLLETLTRLWAGALGLDPSA